MKTKTNKNHKPSSRLAVRPAEWIKLSVAILALLFCVWMVQFGEQTVCESSCAPLWDPDCTRKTTFAYPWYVIVIQAVFVLPTIYLVCRQALVVIRKTQKQKADVIYSAVLSLSISIASIVWAITSFMYPCGQEPIPFPYEF